MRFEFATADQIVFGDNVATELARMVSGWGRNAFVLTGSTPQRYAHLLDPFEAEGLVYTTFPVTGEPTTDSVEAAVTAARQAGADIVVGIGGGSVLDTGKVVAAMLANAGAVLDYLEVVGEGKPLQCRPAPYIAVPTTAGTGAEVTRNAVLCVPDKQVKVSMRSPLMLPRLALVDPVLTHSMPPALTASTGLDALTQLIEAFVSNQANPMTDGFCREGLKRARDALRRAFEDGTDAEARHDMALASLLSGLALANAKLGAVHGLAGPLGGMIGAPHGAICGKLLPHVTEVNVQALRRRAPDSRALPRYDEVAQILTGYIGAGAQEAVTWIRDLCGTLALPGLRQLGLSEADVPDAVAQAARSSSMKGNPIELREEELGEVLRQALA